jgi:hypothetical protein
MAAAVVALHACAGRSGGASGLVDTSVITEDEIDSVHAFNAYEAIYKLRPRFLTSRGKVSLDPSVPPALPNVYVDNMFYGDVTTLRGIAAGAIESIKFYDPGEAQYKFGHGNMAGAIAITTKH